MQTVRTPVLEIAYLESGPPDGPPVILLHGWPSDVHDYDGVAPPLAAAGFRVLVPWLRGFGPTQFLHPATPRSGQQAALGADVRDFMDALSIPRATLVGYDWGGRAACVVAALWPERVAGLVAITGYGIQDIAAASRPAAAEQEFRYWYQWYFHTRRGRAGLDANRGAIARLLWQLWSPNWRFDEVMFQATAASFDNPDFVDVTIHSYRHRYGNAPGDPAHDALEASLAGQPAIAAPTIVLHGEADGVGPPATSITRDRLFARLLERKLIPRAGHFLSRENPADVVAAVVRLAKVPG
ncbi:alpha/beta fold hydrolase [Rhodopila globiformis]|uniref:Alpha/beta hydrolase n=1 Tax=Rhodopila globiformis TaxID=1071 RepID=A0A2S6NLJ3_RHOGL|nr:alpha/beta hydrolase [Rhodopila globiformis]PPQ36305.1 alpha/beta hydrolase [Rhodopila globiformis]